jgi:hypothetical protein
VRPAPICQVKRGTESTDYKPLDPCCWPIISASTVLAGNSDSCHGSRNSENLIRISPLHPMSDGSLRGEKVTRNFQSRRCPDSLPARLRNHVVTICPNTWALRWGRNAGLPISPNIKRRSIVHSRKQLSIFPTPLICEQSHGKPLALPAFDAQRTEFEP